MLKRGKKKEDIEEIVEEQAEKEPETESEPADVKTADKKAAVKPKRSGGLTIGRLDRKSGKTDKSSKGSEKFSEKALYDMGTVIIFCAFVIASIVMSNSGIEMFKINLTMAGVTFAVAVLAAFRVINGAMILAGLQTVIFIGVAISLGSNGKLDSKVLLGWILVPGLLVMGYSFIDRSKKEQERLREVMNEQLDELIMTDPVTGLYNLRSMYMDIQTQISYAERNNKQICLMILKPKYVDELKAVLKQDEFDEVVVRLSKAVCDTVRLEDKVYAIDSEGSFGVILTCDLAGAELVEERLAEKLKDEELYDGVDEEHDIRVEMMLGCVQYEDEIDRDAIRFKRMAEEALRDL